MTGSIALDVVIGLVFVYLLYALLATIVEEAIANVFSFRAKFLEKAIVRMLEDGNAKAASNFRERTAGFFRIFLSTSNKELPVAKAFYRHPLIKYLAEDDFKNKPSYLTSGNFSQTLLALMKGNSFTAGDDAGLFIETALRDNEIRWESSQDKAENAEKKREGLPAEMPRFNPDTLDYLRQLWATAQGDADKFRVLLEEWFDVTMERTTGWYKKHTQCVLFVIGMLIAITFNVDSIKIAGVLSRDPVLREQLVKRAENFTEAHKGDTTKQVRATAQAYWKDASNLYKQDISGVNDALAIGWEKGLDDLRPSSLIGWAITAFALSLGSPFWFDMLNKLMKLRSGVNSAAKENEEKKASPAKTGAA